MFNIFFYTLISIPSGYVISILINDVHFYLCNRPISNNFKYALITTVTFLGFLRGYTGNDLVTNINGYLMTV